MTDTTDALPTFDTLQLPTDRRVVGIDLTASEKRPTGWCLLDGAMAHTRLLATDDALVEATVQANPALVSIDSPLALPMGRLTPFDDDPTRATYGIMRECERVLRKRGIRVYPTLFPSMQRLTERGMRLAERFRALNLPVIESYPGSAQDILAIPRKKAGVDLLRDGLAHFGLRGDFTHTPVSHDELDAITSALVGLFFLAGQYEGLGREEEGLLIVPRIPQTAS